MTNSDISTVAPYPPAADSWVFTACRSLIASPDDGRALLLQNMTLGSAVAVERIVAPSAPTLPNVKVGAEYLRLHRDPDAEAFLVAGLWAHDLGPCIVFEVPSYSALALGYIGDQEYVPALIAALKDLPPYSTVGLNPRGYVLHALGRIGGPQASAFLLRRLKARPNDDILISSVGLLGDSAGVPVLCSALSGASEKQAMSIAYALQDIGDANAEEVLFAMLTDERPTVRRCAGLRLKAISPAHGKDPRVKRASRGKLARLLHGEL